MDFGYSTGDIQTKYAFEELCEMVEMLEAKNDESRKISKARLTIFRQRLQEQDIKLKEDNNEADEKTESQITNLMEMLIFGSYEALNSLVWKRLKCSLNYFI